LEEQLQECRTIHVQPYTTEDTLEFLHHNFFFVTERHSHLYCQDY